MQFKIVEGPSKDALKAAMFDCPTSQQPLVLKTGCGRTFKMSVGHVQLMTNGKLNGARDSFRFWGEMLHIDGPAVNLKITNPVKIAFYNTTTHKGDFILE